MARLQMRAARVLVVGLVATGCAKAPESIAPAYVSELTFLNWQCDQMAAETLRLNAAYAAAARQQTQARGNDVVGVILIGLPVSSLSGDNIAPEIARLKGEQEALRRAMISKGCALPPAPAQAPAPAAPAQVQAAR